MNFKLLSFGVAREIIGENLMVDNPQVSDVASLREWLFDHYPDAKGLSKWAIAVNEEYAVDAVSIKNGDVIAIIPPVSGG
jgi:molybdopterin converting factor small subunit